MTVTVNLDCLLVALCVLVMVNVRAFQRKGLVCCCLRKCLLKVLEFCYIFTLSHFPHQTSVVNVTQIEHMIYVGAIGNTLKLRLLCIEIVLDFHGDQYEQGCSL